MKYDWSISYRPRDSHNNEPHVVQSEEGLDGWMAGYNSADWLNAGLMTDCLAGGLMLAGYNSAGVRMADWLTG